MPQPRSACCSTLASRWCKGSGKVGPATTVRRRNAIRGAATSGLARAADSLAGRSAGKILVMAAMVHRSRTLRRGRAEPRLSTTTCWRSKAFSATSLARPRKASHSRPRKAGKSSRNMAEYHSARPSLHHSRGPYGLLAANSDLSRSAFCTWRSDTRAAITESDLASGSSRVLRDPHQSEPTGTS